MSEDMPEGIHECPYCHEKDIELDTLDNCMYCKLCGVSGPKECSTPYEAYSKWQEMTENLNVKSVSVGESEGEDDDWVE